MTVVELKYFETVADACFVAQSTLSIMIDKFEDEVGIKIFNRKTKPVSIALEGFKIINRLRTIQKKKDTLNNIIKELKGEFIGDLCN